MSPLSASSKVIASVFLCLFFTLNAQAKDIAAENLYLPKQPKMGFFKKMAVKVAQKRLYKCLAVLPFQMDSTSPCAKIELMSGIMIDVELASLSQRTVRYRPCGEPDADLKSVELSMVKTIVARNGDVLHGKTSEQMKQVMLTRKAIPFDSTGRCGYIVFKDGSVESIELATWEPWGVHYRRCGTTDGELKMARFEETTSVYARNGEQLYAADSPKISRVSAVGPLLLVILGILGGIFGIVLISFGIYLSAKRLKKLKNNPKANVGNKGMLKVALVLGLIFLLAYVFFVLPVLFF